MSASNSRKALSPAWSVCSLSPNTAQQIMHHAVLEQQIRVQNPAVTNYTFLKYWFGSVEKIVSESVSQNVSCGFLY